MSPDHYNLHVAALEWSLDAPITIRGEADIQSKRIWADRLEPYAHQVQNLITFCRRAPVALLADDVGLGKTISAGLILSELIVRKKVSRAFVVAPKLLLSQWQEELAVKFGIAAQPATGADLPAAVRGRMPVVISTYHSLRSYLPDLRLADFDMVILDEAHKLRNLHGTAQPPQFAVGVRQALSDRVFKYVLMLTATPIQNRLWDLYSLVDLLTAAKGHTNPLGTPGSFKANYIDDPRAVRIRAGRREEFRQHLSNYIVRTRRSDAKLVFPSRRVQTYRVTATPLEATLLHLVGSLLRDQPLNGLSQSSIGQALMSSPQALASQLETMAARGNVPRSVADQVRGLVAPQPVSAKLAGLLALIQQLVAARPHDWRVVVFTSRTKTQEAIGQQLKAAGIPTGFIAGGRADENERALRAFRESPPRVRALVSTDAGAEGINLQVANVLVNFDLPWNPMVLEQRIGRVQRLASTHAEVTVLNLVLAGSVEEHVVARLSEKLQAISESLGDVEGILESRGGGEDEESFEAIIRKLVVDSLKGLDVEKATRLALKSIQEAKDIFDAERETVEKTLGDLKDLHRTGPRVPEISPVVPSIDARDFVLRALAGDGGKIDRVGDDIHAVTLPGRNAFRITFRDRAFDADENGVFGNNHPRLYLPGKRDFERLAQSWAEKSGALIVDRSQPSEAVIEELLVEWLRGQSGFALADFEIAGRQEGFAGELLCRASVAVAHDRLEKLITVPVAFGPEVPMEPHDTTEPISQSEYDTSRLAEELRQRVTAAIELEPDLTKFSTFYRARREEELKASGDAELQRRVRDQFTPIAAADAVGATGTRFVELQVLAKVRVDGEGPYNAEFVVVPGSVVAKVLPANEWHRCQHSGRAAPPDATDICSLTGQRVLKNYLGTSAESGKRALTAHMVRCEESGALLLPEETGFCEVTAKRVARSLLAVSDVSGRRGMAVEMAKCEFTSANVLPVELAVSEISGKRFRCDQAATSVVSGRSGHVSEFVVATIPEGLVATAEAEKSAVSGAWAAVGQMVRSELPPGRLGLPSETVRSEVSGKMVLKDEVVASELSGKLALPEELVQCEFTSAKGLPEEMSASEISGKRYRLADRTESVVSRRSGHRSEFVTSVLPEGPLAPDEAAQSEVTGVWAHKDRISRSDLPPHRCALAAELVVSAATGKRYLPAEVVRSKLSGEAAHADELVRCEFTGDAVLPSELMVSQISGKRGRRDQHLVSAHSKRVGHPSEFVLAALPAGQIAVDEVGRSDLSGKIAAKDLLVRSELPPHRMGLPAETITSVVSGKRVLEDEVKRSALSGSVALPEELRACEFTGAQVLPGELEKSAISGKMFRIDEATSSALSGRRGHSSEFVSSVSPTGWIATDEAGRSALSGEWGAVGSLAPSERPPHRRGLPHELVACEVSGRRLLRDETALSAVSGRRVDTALLLESAASGALATAEEMIVCSLTGRRVLPVESGVCAITGGRVDLRELARSEASGATGIKSKMARCSESGKLVLPAELILCAVTGRPVLQSETATCSITGRRALKRQVESCPTSGALFINDELTRKAIESSTGAAGTIHLCPWTGRRMLATLTDTCSVTGLRIQRTELNDARELRTLRALVDGRASKEAGQLRREIVDWLRTASPDLKNLSEVQAITGPGGEMVALTGRLKIGLLGFTSNYCAIAAKVSQPPALLAPVVLGKRTPSGWVRNTP